MALCGTHCCWRDDQAQDDLQQRQQALGIGVQEAIVTQTTKTGRQHVPQDLPEELDARLLRIDL